MTDFFLLESVSSSRMWDGRVVVLALLSKNIGILIVSQSGLQAERYYHRSQNFTRCFLRLFGVLTGLFHSVSRVNHACSFGPFVPFGVLTVNICGEILIACRFGTTVQTTQRVYLRGKRFRVSLGRGAFLSLRLSFFCRSCCAAQPRIPAFVCVGTLYYVLSSGVGGLTIVN